MAWNYGNKMWTIPFKSLNETNCRIDIYKRDYTGSTVLTLVGANDPFYFDEDDSDDILNGVIRYRTGYIRVVEQYSYGFLDDIYPTSKFDRYVEVMYGSTVIFNGYIQVQDFSSELVPVPRVLELPVISPLGLFEAKTFSNTAYLQPTSKSLGELLDVILANETYSYVYFPKSYGYPNTVDLNLKISTLVVTPYNDNFHHSMNVNPMNKVMKGESYAYLIEGICKAFGWICHDMPDALVFTSFDYEGEYCYYPVGHIGQSGYKEDADISSSEVTLTDYFTPADNNANIQTLLPDTGIEIYYEGDPNNRTFSFDRTYVSANPVVIMPSFLPYQSQYSGSIERFSLCNLIPVPNIWETNLDGEFTFDENDKLNVGTHCVAWNGNEGAMISLGSYESGRDLFWIRFYMRRRQNQMFAFSYSLLGRKDGAIGGLQSNSDVSELYITTVFDSSNADYVQITFKYNWHENTEIPQLPLQALIFIYNMQLQVLEDSLPYESYRFKPVTDNDIIPATGNPAISSQISMPISCYRLNDHLIGDAVMSTKLTEYTYLFQPRKKITSKFRVSNIMSFPHVRLFSYMNRKWRIIAQSFHPHDDEYKLTMQHSPVL